MTCVRRLVVVVVSALAVVLLGGAYAWAAHPPTPVPSLRAGQTVVQTAQTCRRDLDALGSEVGHHCAAGAWHVVDVLPAGPIPVQAPSPLPVTAPAALPVTAPTALPVIEQAPGGTTTVTAVAECGTTGKPACLAEWGPATTAAAGSVGLALVLAAGVRIVQGLRR